MAEGTAVQPTTPLRILFVDDERDLVSSLSRYFRLKGFQTKGAYGVQEGIAVLEEERAASRRFDVVVTDLRMPDGDGLAIVRAVRRVFPGIPVLVLTAFGTVATSVEAMRLGAVTMLEKPIPVADLLATVAVALGIDHQKQNPSNVGRPIRITDPGSRPIKEVLA